MPRYHLTCIKAHGRFKIYGTSVVAPMPPKSLQRLAIALNKRFPERQYRLELGGRQDPIHIREVDYSPVDFIGVH
jgi:hypothetical protein